MQFFDDAMQSCRNSSDFPVFHIRSAGGNHPTTLVGTANPRLVITANVASPHAGGGGFWAIQYHRAAPDETWNPVGEYLDLNGQYSSFDLNMHPATTFKVQISNAVAGNYATRIRWENISAGTGLTTVKLFLATSDEVMRGKRSRTDELASDSLKERDTSSAHRKWGSGSHRAIETPANPEQRGRCLSASSGPGVQRVRRTRPERSAATRFGSLSRVGRWKRAWRREIMNSQKNRDKVPGGSALLGVERDVANRLRGRGDIAYRA